MVPEEANVTTSHHNHSACLGAALLCYTAAQLLMHTRGMPACHASRFDLRVCQMSTCQGGISTFADETGKQVNAQTFRCLSMLTRACAWIMTSNSTPNLLQGELRSA